MAADPVLRERRRAGIIRRNRTDPVRREQLKQIMVIARAAREPRSVEHMRYIGALGRAAKTPESFARAGAAVTAHRLSWCPPHLRDDYRLATRKGYPPAEARAMIEAHHELEMARWRRSVGITQEQLEAAVPKELTPLDHAIAIAAKRFRVSAEEIMGAGRKRRQTRARFALTAAMRRAGMAYLTIAKGLGRTDHSSAMHWASQAEVFAARDTKFARILAELVLCWQPVEEAA